MWRSMLYDPRNHAARRQNRTEPSMPIEVFSQEWTDAYCEQLNLHEPYRSAAAGWDDSVVLMMRSAPEQGIEEDRAVYLELRGGHCHGARVATETDLAEVPYHLSATPEVWKQMLARTLEPISAVMQGKLRLERGSLTTLARYAAAARELVVAATRVDAIFPEAGA